MPIKGPLSFQLMVYSIACFVATVLTASFLGVFAALLSVAGFFLAVAGVTCGIYELKDKPDQKLLSMLGLSISGTIVVIVTIFMIFVFSTLSNERSHKTDKDKYQASEYR